MYKFYVWLQVDVRNMIIRTQGRWKWNAIQQKEQQEAERQSFVLKQKNEELIAQECMIKSKKAKENSKSNNITDEEKNRMNKDNSLQVHKHELASSNNI